MNKLKTGKTLMKTTLGLSAMMLASSALAMPFCANKGGSGGPPPYSYAPPMQPYGPMPMQLPYGPMPMQLPYGQAWNYRALPPVMSPAEPARLSVPATAPATGGAY